MKKTFLHLIFFALSAILCFSCGKPAAEHELHSLTGSTMGTTYSIKLVCAGTDQTNINFAELKLNVDSLLRDINQQMSTYIEDSEISLFNRSEKSGWFNISSDFADVLEMSFYISDKSGGAFDVTIGPLVNLWGFGPSNVAEEIPSQNEIDKHLKSVGYKNLEIVKNPPALKKNNKNVNCDLSAIAKGFAVDKVSEYFESERIINYMVEIGGEVRTKGTNATGAEWQIGIAAPDYGSGLQKVVAISNYSLATSGDYMNYFEKDGKRYSHTIDPRTGRPITHNLASVSVVHVSCMIADGMATAINVMGPEEGYAFALNEELPVFMIVREGGKFIEKMTPGFEKFLTKTID